MMRMRRGPGIVGMAARTAVVAGTATAVSGRVARRQQRKYAGQDAAYTEQQAAAAEQGMTQAAAAPAPAGGDDMAAQIEELAKLKDQGLLTDEEFAAKKKQILGI
jgi:Short C-terminal domain